VRYRDPVSGTVLGIPLRRGPRDDG
jgi:hypothetical protein